MSSPDPKSRDSLGSEPELSETPRPPEEQVPDPSRLEAVRARIQAIAGTSVAPAANRWPAVLKVGLPLFGAVGALVGAMYLARQVEAPLASMAPSAFVKSMQLPPAGSSPNSTLPLPPPAHSQAMTAAGAPLAPSLSNSSEQELVKQAAQVLESEPARALELAGEHARRFPKGSLADEREAIAIEALARLGQHGAALSRAELFKAVYPKSAQLARVQRAAGLEARDGASAPR